MVLSPFVLRRCLVFVALASTSAGVNAIVAAQKPGYDEVKAGKDKPKNKKLEVKPAAAEVAAKAITEQVAAYREWRKVNPEAHWVPGPIAIMCAPASMPRKGGGKAASPENPHEDKWVRVYVNGAGEAAMLTQKVPEFPRGTLIVKEKLPQKNSEKPELLTVMAKREEGYDAENGDWEYLTFNGDASKVAARGKLANCQSCHIPQKENGYVFRDYLPDEVKKELR